MFTFNCNQFSLVERRNEIFTLATLDVFVVVEFRVVFAYFLLSFFLALYVHMLIVHSSYSDGSGNRRYLEAVIGAENT